MRVFKNFTVWLFLLIGLALIGCGGSSRDGGEEQIVGGWSDISTDAQSALLVAEFIESELEDGVIDTILDAQVQVVAGSNYKLTIQLDDGTIYQAVVYQDLQGIYELTSLDLIE